MNQFFSTCKQVFWTLVVVSIIGMIIWAKIDRHSARAFVDQGVGDLAFTFEPLAIRGTNELLPLIIYVGVILVGFIIIRHLFKLAFGKKSSGPKKS